MSASVARRVGSSVSRWIGRSGTAGRPPTRRAATGTSRSCRSTCPTAPSRGPRAPRARAPARATIISTFSQIAQKRFSATHALLERQVAEVEQLEHLVLVLDRVVIASSRFLRETLLVRLPHVRDERRRRLRELLGHVASSNSVTPSTLTTSTEWCAATARPDSVTMFGCGTPSASQISLHRVDDVVRVLLHRVVHRRREVRLRAVVVDAEAAADVEVLERRAELVAARRERGPPRAARSSPRGSPRSASRGGSAAA